ncbi:MAG: TlpA family protein disulfide reductase [Nitrospirae bacterium]|nr:MAG: TlpA family protein disulfide reductase [Nitrospirota bacterium]
MRRHPSLLLALLVPLLLGASARGSVAAPDFTLPTDQGGTYHLADSRGKEVVVLFAWASWCPSCREEMPLMNRLHDELAGLPVRFFGVNMQESPKQVARARERHKLRFDILLDQQGSFARAYNIYGIPQVMVIDKEGRLRYRDYRPPQNLVAAVKALAAE